VEEEIARLDVVRLSAELALRGMCQWPLERRCSVAHGWPVLSLYGRLVESYEEASRELHLWEAILRRTDGAGAADSFRTPWSDLHGNALRALLYLGVLLNLPCYLWWKERLRAAAEDLASRGTPEPGEEPRFLGLAHGEMVKLLGMSPALEKEFFLFRGWERWGKNPDHEGVRGEADASALWQAYQRADESLSPSVVPELTKRFAESKDPYGELEALPFALCIPAEKKAQSIIRRAYRDLRPRVLASTYADLPVPVDADGVPTKSDRDPADYAVHREGARWRESEVEALVMQREDAWGVLPIRQETQREASTALWERARVELTSKQYEVLLESEQAFREGYCQSSKTGRLTLPPKTGPV
jgi:hypothetical protein